MMTVTDVAAELGVSTLTVRRRIDAGELPAVQLGGPGTAIRVPRRALDAWLWSGAEERSRDAS